MQIGPFRSIQVIFQAGQKKKPGAGGYTGLPHTKVLRSGEKPKDEVFKYKYFLIFGKHFCYQTEIFFISLV